MKRITKLQQLATFVSFRDQIIFTTLYKVVLFKLGRTDGIQNYFVATFKVLIESYFVF